jgi:hypothetical protein
VTPLAERRLIQVWWTDATNVAGGWFGADDLDEWAVNGAWECSNTGWVVYEDEKCYVLAGRMTDDGQNVGLIERVPKAAVTRTVVHAVQVQPSPAASLATGRLQVSRPCPVPVRPVADHPVGSGSHRMASPLTEQSASAASMVSRMSADMSLIIPPVSGSGPTTRSGL